MQSRTIYQASGDKLQESQARVAQVNTLLDISTWRRRLAQSQTKKTGKIAYINNATLLDDAEEQCRQVLLRWLPPHKTKTISTPPVEVEIYLYSAIAHMILVSTDRAVVAQLGNYTDTGRRELSLATHYCQQLLDTLNEEPFPWMLVYELATVQRSNVQYQALSLPHIPNTSSTRHVLAQSITYYAAGIVSEILGRSANHPAYIYDAYQHSDACIRLSLENAQLAYEQKLVDVSYVVRCYQRCIGVLETREDAAAKQEIEIDGTLRSILKDGLQKLATPLL